MKKLIAGAMLFGSLIMCGYRPAPETIEYRYTVNEGDTIWDVASYIATEKEDVRDIVRTIVHDNNVKNAVITPGQELIIRVPKAR